jgi:DNA processing protein
MSQLETAALIALLRRNRQGRPWHLHAELVEQSQSAMACLERDLSESDTGQMTLGAADDRDELLAQAMADLAAWTGQGIRVLTVLDTEYPQNLRGVHDRPPLIFVAGHLEPADARSVAVIGSRHASEGGRALAGEIARHLTLHGYGVISGLAAGIDTAAHTATLQAGGKTMAVIGTGLKHAYPPQNAALQKQIVDRGALISQFWPDAPPRSESFPMRNAVMSGVSLGTVVVEASHRSGVRIQARKALAHGRPVFVAESLTSQNWARELCHRPGTHSFQTPDEITTTLSRLTSSEMLVG